MSRPAADPERALVELAWLCAGTSGRRSEEQARIAALVAGIGWEELASSLSRRRLLTLLGPRLSGLAEKQSASGFQETLDRALSDSRRHASALLTCAEMIVSELADRGVRAVELKGPGAGEALYGDAGRRASGDLDLLVAAEHLGPAVEVARGLGYGPPQDPLGEEGLPLLHLTLSDPRRRLPTLELHWRIHWYERRFARERLLGPPAAPRSWHPEPVDELLALLLYFARDGFMNVRHASDLGAFWDRRGELVGEPALAARLREWPALAPALRAAARVAELVVGLPGAQLLGAESDPSARGRMAVALARPRPRRSEAQIHAEMALVDGLLAPPGQRLAFVRRQLLQPRSVRRERARQTGARRAGSAIGHCARSLARYALALARIPCGAVGSRLSTASGR
jgi:Uncharacterised nucleotidyltransferase